MKKIILEISVKGKKKKKKEKKIEKLQIDPAQEYFEVLNNILEREEQPSREEIIATVNPMITELERLQISNGLFDILSPQARKSILMLFLVHMLQDVEQPETKQGFPDKVPLDISEGDDIPDKVVDGQVAYNQTPRQKLDAGF